jgi:hypothetical protein
MATLLVPMHVYALILMHAYPSAYAYQFDYVCLCCHLIMPICFCLWLLMRVMHAYVCLFTCLWFYDISEGKIHQDYAVWRQGKWLVRILGIEVA